MKRKLIENLLQWKEQMERKPLLITGAKGVGKTYLAYDFGKSYYDNIVYVNFETEPGSYDKFLSQSEESLYEQLKLGYHLREPEESSTLAILDDIQFCPDIKRILSAYNKVLPGCDLLCISDSSEPFGDLVAGFLKLQLYPLDFEEFLLSIGDKWYIDAIAEHYRTNKKIPGIVHNELLHLLEQYLTVGGMPLAVNEYINTGGLFNISNQHKLLLQSYLSEATLMSESEALKVRQILNTIPAQLYKENKKFQYTLIRKGATQTMYSCALEYLVKSGYGLLCKKMEDGMHAQDFANNVEEINLFTSLHNFKFYILDVGILYTMLKKETKLIQEKLRKGLLENYIAQSLLVGGYNTYYWESSSSARIDFVISRDGCLLPIEVWPSEYTRSKNLSIFKAVGDKAGSPIKISTKNFDYRNGVKYVPLYAVFCI